MHHSKSVILTSDISDHLPCLVLINCECDRTKQPLSFERRNLSQESMTKIKNDLSATDWNNLNDLDTNDSYNLMMTRITETLDKHAPLRKVTIPVKYVITESWMTKGLIKSSRTCDNMYSKVIGLDKHSVQFLSYKTYRNLYNKLKRRAKITYFKNKIIEHYTDSRKLWKTLNTLIGRNNDKSSLSDTFNINGTTTSDPNKISNGFCEYFTNVGKTLAFQNSKYSKQSSDLSEWYIYKFYFFFSN